MENIVIVAAARTAIGKFGGTLANTPASDLSAAVIKDLLSRADLKPTDIDEVILGNTITAGMGQNPARQASIKAGLPISSTAMTLNKVCGSGLKAIQLAALSLLANETEISIAGGQENMSMAPHVLPNSRNGKRMGDWKLIDSMVYDGLWEVFNNYHMGVTAENVSEQFNITRKEQDELALESQIRTKKAIEQGKFENEIIPLTILQPKKDPIIFKTDEYPRETSLEALAKLPGAFKENGTVTAGNASGVNDGAAGLILTTEKKALELGLKILARIKGFGFAGVEPKIMGTGPIAATKKCLAKVNWNIQDIDLFEVNEAFANVPICFSKEFTVSMNKINVNGGAIALGHPIGASGARIIVTLLHEMIRQDLHKGLATLCIGGG
ncbi:MAG: acetyl-CoA C-acetyltransferase, partial [Candidatus Margulisiibacteriota bacterium]